MKIKITAHIYFHKYEWQHEGKYQVSPVRFEDNEDCTHVGKQEIEIEVPDNYDPRAQKIAVLEKQKQQIMADYQKSVMEINDSISKLTAIEYTGEQT